VADTPDAMKQKGREADPIFDPEEKLYRRFQPEAFEDGSVTIDAIELPDMSVNRGKYGPPEWVLISETDRYDGWGVLAFEVRNIPNPVVYRGIRTFTFGPVHCPQRQDFPHTEIWAFENGEHVSISDTVAEEAEIHLRWRQNLLWRSNVVITPIVL
jgi:hypothetical protein